MKKALSLLLILILLSAYPAIAANGAGLTENPAESGDIIVNPNRPHYHEDTELDEDDLGVILSKDGLFKYVLYYEMVREKVPSYDGDGNLLGYWNDYNQVLRGAVIVGYLGTETEVVIPAEIDDYAVYGVAGLSSLDTNSTITSVILSDGIERVLNTWTSMSDLTALRKVVLPDSVTVIEKDAFRSCTALEEITLGRGVKTIGEYAFAFCTSLKSITIPDSVEEIGSYAFYGASALTSADLGSGVKTIGHSVFSREEFIGSTDIGESSLSAINVSPKNPVFSSDDGVLYSKDGTKLILYPPAKEGPFTTPSKVKKILPYAFEKCTGITSLKLSDSVKEIGTYAFYKCSAQSWEFGRGINTISSYSFYRSTVDRIPQNIKSIPYMAFYDCRNFTEIIIPDGVRYIADSAFEDTYASTVTIPSSVQSIGNRAFDGNYQLEELNLSEGLLYIGSDAFGIAFSLSWVSIPSSVSEIEPDAFYHRTGIIGEKYSYAETYANSTGRQFKEREGDNVKIPLNSLRITLDGDEKCAPKGYTTGHPFATIMDGSAYLWEYTDYIRTFENDQDAGIATMTITGTGAYTGEVILYYIVEPRNVIEYSRKTAGSPQESYIDATLPSDSYAYTGAAVRPPVTVCEHYLNHAPITLEEGVDYNVQYINNTDVGTATARATLKGNYSGVIDQTFRITGDSVEDADIRLSQTSYNYDGTQKRPDANVYFGSKKLTYGSDYTLEYQDNVNAGNAAVIISGHGNYSGTKRVSFTISPMNISSAVITTEADSYYYDGSEKRPAVSVRAASVQLLPDKDYTVSYLNNTNVGTATVRITGRGNYTGFADKTFRITRANRDISCCTVTIGSADYNAVYTGSPITPAVTVSDGDRILTGGSDYTVSYSSNTDAGYGMVTITGEGDYTGTLQKAFEIHPAGISASSVSVSSASQIYDGTEKHPSVTVSFNSKKLTLNKDYTLTYRNCVNAGTASVEVSFRGNFTGSVTKYYTVSKRSFDGADISLQSYSFTYDGTAKNPAVTVKLNGTVLIRGTDYSVSYGSNISPGTASVTVTPKGNYSGSAVQKHFTIVGRSISSACAAVIPQDYDYTGSPIHPVITLSDGDTVLEEGTDYTLSYTNNIYPGYVTVTVTGIGKYEGTTVCGFTISPLTFFEANVSLGQDTFVYDGQEKRPAVTVTYRGSVLKQDKDYSVSYSNNIKAGTAHVTVKGINGYAGNVRKEFSITSAVETLVWGEDNWSFLNAYGVFPQVARSELINEKYAQALLKSLSNVEYYRVFGNSGYLNQIWKGSCFGMSALVIASLYGLLPYAEYTPGAQNLHQLNRPSGNDDTMSLITYYHMMQKKDVILNEMRNTLVRSHESNIKTLLANLDRDGVALVCFQMDGYGGHAIVAYGYEKATRTIDNHTFDTVIHICDPNETSYNKDADIYVNTQDNYTWIIPSHYADNGSVVASYNGALLSYVGSNIADINSGGYLSGTVSRTASGKLLSTYVSRLNVATLSEKAKVSKAYESYSGFYSTTSDDISVQTMMSPDGTGDTEYGYDLNDCLSAYSVTQDDPDKMELTITYPDALSSVTADKAVSAVMNCDGTVLIDGENMNYELSITLNEDFCPTDWDTVTISGTGADEVSVAPTDEGYILSADTLLNINIEAQGRTSGSSRSFSTDEYSEVLIYEADPNNIGVRVDTDHNGTYETDLFPVETSGYILGDVDNDNKVDVFDASSIQKSIAGTNGYVDYTAIDHSDIRFRVADVDGNGMVDIFDASLIQKWIAGDEKAKRYRIGKAI